MRILVVEDEIDLNKIICKKLKSEGYSVDSCYNGKEALEYIESAEYDVILMDIMMPKLDGMAAIRELRNKGNNTPVIFLTAKDAVGDKVLGLDSGADDYIVKPFSFEELMARIRVSVRKKAEVQTNIYTLADLKVDSSSHTVERSGRNIILSSKEFALLEFMIRNQGTVLSREKIENNIWNFDYEGGTNAVDVYIRYLRRKIDDSFERKLIHTVRGSGYVLMEEK